METFNYKQGIDFIPFRDCVVSKENFDEIKDFENFNLSIKHIDDYISIEFKNTIPPPIYYFVSPKTGDKFYCFVEKTLNDYLIDKFKVNTRSFYVINPLYELEEKLPVDMVYQSHKYLYLFCVKMYKNLRIYKDKITYDIIDDLFKIPIENAGEIIKNWVNKYTNLFNNINSVIGDNKLYIELSSGLDTRCLIYFWKNCPKKDITIYTKLTEDGANIEAPVVKQIAEYISNKYNKNITVVHKKNNPNITLNGRGGDMYGIHQRLNNIEYLRCYPSLKAAHHYFENILPIMDTELLKIKADYPGQLKKYLQVLLAEEFIGKFPYYSFARRQFVFTEDDIKEAKEMIKKWGIVI